MCPRAKIARIGANQYDIASGLASIRQYTPPIYKETKDCSYIEFYAFDPERGEMRRKKIKLNRIKGVTNRKCYARDLIKRLNDQLIKGWNPWIAKDTTELKLFEEALERYVNHIAKMYASGYFREETYIGYRSNIKILREYIAEYRQIYYAYQFDRNFCIDFLDYVFIERNNGAQTRNNYLNFLRVLSGFMVEKGYLKTKPTEGIAPISKRLYKKERTVIPKTELNRIADYCREKDPFFLLPCYLLFYCMIRPVEMTRLKISSVSVRNRTLTIPASASKNKKVQTVTIPRKVMEHAIEMGVLTSPSADYLFSKNLKPGEEAIDTKIFRDHWAKLSRALKFKREWKFYSLKDSGITELLKSGHATISVRDQARHSSLAITELYTDHCETANPAFMNVEGSL